MTSLADIRPGERSLTSGAFATLLLTVAAHVVLETARDALFLARLPASNLPFTYLGIAFVSLVVFYLEQRRREGTVTFAGLAAWLAASAGVTAVFWLVVDPDRPVLYYALYVWSGVVSTLVVSRFWTLAGARFDVGQARRLFPVLTLGGIVGAVAGSYLAGRLATPIGSQGLLGVSAALFAAAALVPMIASRPWRNTEPQEPAPVPDSRESIRSEYRLRRTLSLIHVDPYLRRVGILLLLSTVAFTLVDYLFKATVAREVPAESLGSFFARAYLVFNLLSLVAQLVVVRYLVPLVRRLKIDQLLSILPGLVLAGAGAFLTGLGFTAAYALKGLDGTFRYSLHRTSSEMLFVPIPSTRRVAVKGLLDVLGQRGGQALASLVILVVVALPQPLVIIAALIVCGAIGWMWAARSILPHYLDLFRRSLMEGSHSSRLGYPQMDLASLESLLRSLSSADDGEVLAAVDVFAEKSRLDLVPGLILYHPSTEVVLRALDLFAEAGRTDILPLLDRLLSSDVPEIRAAALRARLWLAPDPSLPQEFQRDSSPVVRAAAWVGQATFLGEDEALRAVEREAASSNEAVHLALARAIRFSPSQRFDRALIHLAQSPSLRAREAAAEAMREIRSPDYVPSLLAMLSERDLRLPARRTLVAIGPEALVRLRRALDNRWLDPQIRKHLPRSIHRFENQDAVDALLAALSKESDPVVEHKILRALGGLSYARPELEYDDRVLFAVTLAKLRTAYRFLDYELQVREEGERDPKTRTNAQELLVALLRQKHRTAVEHVFRLLGVAYRKVGEDFREMHRGIESNVKQKRAGARELLENILDPPLREPLLLMLEDLSAREILARAREFYVPRSPDYETLLRELLEIDETGVRCLVAYHVGELPLPELTPVLAALPSDRDRLVSRSVEFALERMEVGA
ncbi:MAG: hypothetical protein H6682_07220 [Candidatus Eisenbacteria bacterium]|nr:hypothetical protein [Candidatus Eisenbacteria bacterium]